jgi:hypothetical protein
VIPKIWAKPATQFKASCATGEGLFDRDEIKGIYTNIQKSLDNSLAIGVAFLVIGSLLVIC